MVIVQKFGRIGNNMLITKADSPMESLLSFVWKINSCKITKKVVCLEDIMTKFLDLLNQLVWGVPALGLILGVGIYLSVRTGWVQFKLFPTAMKSFSKQLFCKKHENGISSYRALCTALSATVGTGNLAGVAGAIAIGGPGAVFWMWICAILGMVTKFAEATLSVRYRECQADGSYVGGPMYIVENGMSNKWQILACFYCFFGVVASFGVGAATQINAAIGGINGAILANGGKISAGRNFLIGVIFAVIMLHVLFGGAKRVSAVAAFVVPFASLFYIILCLGVLVCKTSVIPNVILSIFKGAFCPQAVTGGILGSVVQSLRIGASRGVFTNEAGMGTAGIAHASANVDHPVQQGLMGIIEVFLDTIVICTLTAMVIFCSGISIPYGEDLGIQITADAFAFVYGDWVHFPLAISICSFAVATVFGWGLYGASCAKYLFGNTAWKYFVVFQVFSIITGAVMNTGTVWSIAETANGLMAIPNLMILIYFVPEVVKLINEYKIFFDTKVVGGGTNENFNQCKPLRTIAYEKVSPAGGKGKK